MKTPEEIADFIWGQHDAEFLHEETMIDDMTWEDFVAWIKEEPDVDNIELSDQQYKDLVELRGGCSCHINPPCCACSDPITKTEAKTLRII